MSCYLPHLALSFLPTSPSPPPSDQTHHCRASPSFPSAASSACHNLRAHNVRRQVCIHLLLHIYVLEVLRLLFFASLLMNSAACLFPFPQIHLPVSVCSSVSPPSPVPVVAAVVVPVVAPPPVFMKTLSRTRLTPFPLLRYTFPLFFSYVLPIYDFFSLSLFPFLSLSYTSNAYTHERTPTHTHAHTTTPSGKDEQQARPKYVRGGSGDTKGRKRKDLSH